jgi:hypothetical protein
VRVISGPLSEQIGMLAVLRPHERVLVLLHMLGGQQRVELRGMPWRRFSNPNLRRVRVLKGEIFPGAEVARIFSQSTYGLPRRLSIGRLQPLCEKLQPGADLYKNGQVCDRSRKKAFVLKAARCDLRH